MGKTFKHFEDILAWQKARQLVNRVYELFSAEKFSREFILKDQLVRASISSMTNIAE